MARVAELSRRQLRLARLVEEQAVADQRAERPGPVMELPGEREQL